MNDMISFEELNDDCLEIIFYKINLLEQYRITKINQRFYNIIHRIWRNHQQHTLIDNRLLPLRSANNDGEFVEFMIAISSYIQHLQVFELSCDIFCLLNDCIFPTIVSFDLTAKFPSDEDIYQVDCYTNNEILMMQKIMPNLKVLKLRCCDISGKYLSDFEKLEKIHLSHCPNLDPEYFLNLFRKANLEKVDFMEECDELGCKTIRELRNCPKLKHLKIADYDLCIERNLMHDLLRLPNLNKLSIYSKNFVLDVLERAARNPIKAIEAFKFNGKLQSLRRFFEKIELMKLLRLLTINGCMDSEQEEIRNDMLLSVAMELTDLIELHWSRCKVESDLGLLHFIKYCPQLRLIEINNVDGVNISFIWRTIEILKMQKMRKEPLKIYMSRNIIGDSINEDIRVIDNSRLVKIYPKSLTAIKRPSGVLKFKFFSN